MFEHALNMLASATDPILPFDTTRQAKMINYLIDRNKRTNNNSKKKSKAKRSLLLCFDRVKTETDLPPLGYLSWIALTGWVLDRFLVRPTFRFLQ